MWFKKLKRKTCFHTWEYFCDKTKRKCPKCHSEEWLFMKKYPSSTEPSLTWRPMNFDELTFL